MFSIHRAPPGAKNPAATSIAPRISLSSHDLLVDENVGPFAVTFMSVQCRRRGTGGPTFVVVMQTTHVSDLDDLTADRRLRNPWDGSILVQRERVGHGPNQRPGVARHRRCDFR